MDDAGKSSAPVLVAPVLVKVVSIVSAYVSHNSLRAADLPDLIASVHASISALSPTEEVVEPKTPDSPAVSIKKSVTRDHIVCLEDGKKFKSLRRHLSSFHNLTPEDYRAKWKLPSDYPMVAPAYSATRSQLAKESGLGQVGKPETAKPQTATTETATADMTASEPTAEPVPKKAGRGRPRKTAA